MQILCYYENIMNMFQQKSLILQCKETTSMKEEIIRLHSDWLKDFQNSISEFYAKIPGKHLWSTFFLKTLWTGSCDSPKYEVLDLDIYVFEES